MKIKGINKMVSVEREVSECGEGGERVWRGR